MSFASNYTDLSNFYPLEVVARGSETQLQVGKNLNYKLSALNVKESK